MDKFLSSLWIVIIIVFIFTLVITGNLGYFISNPIEFLYTYYTLYSEKYSHFFEVLICTLIFVTGVSISMWLDE